MFWLVKRPAQVCQEARSPRRAFATPGSHARLQPLLRAPRQNEPTVSDQTLFSRAAAADRHWWWLTPLLLSALILPGLGAAGLLDPWEMDRAAVARKMAAAPTVLVVEPGNGPLLDALSKQTAGRYALAHPFDEILNHRIMHIGFQQRHAHLAHRRIDIFRRELAPAAEILENLF